MISPHRAYDEFTVIGYRIYIMFSLCLQLLEFATEHKEELSSATRAILQAVEQAEANIRWIDNNHATIRDWMRRNTA